MIEREAAIRSVNLNNLSFNHSCNLAKTIFFTINKAYDLISRNSVSMCNAVA